MDKPKTSFKTTVEWKTIPWRKLERKVFKLQKRIYRASERGDVKTVRKLQKTLMKSWSAKCLAVRRGTQDHQSKKTAGIDKVKSITPNQQLLELSENLKLSPKAKPNPCVWLKPRTTEKRLLGIPTITDRALQALVKLAMEPEWEAQFEPNTYGFRPGRSCHDAIVALHGNIKQKAKYVLNADIAKCFDSINHEALLKKLNTSPAIRRQIRAWLIGGMMDKGLFPTPKETPQTRVILPLLANIALHGMENLINQAFSAKQGISGRWSYSSKATVIRYASELVILHEDLSVIHRCQQLLTKWLSEMGVELKPSKTRITHTLINMGEKPGFNFLGFHIRQYPVGKNQSGKVVGHTLGFKTLIKPSSESLKEHSRRLATVIDTHKNKSQTGLIAELNALIRGWANYYSSQVSRDAYEKADMLTYMKLRAWANKRHPNKGRKWQRWKYWREDWTFASRESGERLYKHSETPIIRHIKVQGNRSPYDGDWVYWSTRMGNFQKFQKLSHHYEETKLRGMNDNTPSH